MVEEVTTKPDISREAVEKECALDDVNDDTKAMLRALRDELDKAEERVSRLSNDVLTLRSQINAHIENTREEPDAEDMTIIRHATTLAARLK